MPEATLQDLAAAIHDQLVAADAAEVARERRDAAIWRLVNEDGVPGRQAPSVIRDYLLGHGFTAEQVDGAGISYGTVKLAARVGRRPTGP